MKYLSIILLLMAGLIAIVLVVTLIIIGFGTMNQENGSSLQQSNTIAPRSTPTYTTNLTTKSDQDPIIGAWLNGIVFFANGTVGGAGRASWSLNENQNNSYFVISEVPSTGPNSGSVSSTEWIYNPASDRINKRGSSEYFSRGVPKPVFTPIPAVTTIQTQPTQEIPTTGIPKKFSLTDCIDVCKMNYYADHHIGFYNDCLNTCNIENLKASN